MTLLEGTNLRKTYRMSRRSSVDALRGVDVSIAAGEMVAIMGPSGSGKSTLMHVLGLLHAPDRDGGLAPGLRFNGIDVTSLSDRERTRIRARSMGFVFQSFNLVPTLTAEENVALAAEYAGRRGARHESLPGRHSRRSVSRIGPHTGRRSSLVANSSGQPSREPWSTIRRSFSVTSRPATSTPDALRRCWRYCGRSTGSEARRCCSSRTTPKSAPPATASSGCGTA